MARPKGRPRKTPPPAPGAQAARATVINLKGSEGQAEWLEAAHRATHIPKAAIVRLALAMWGQKNGRPPFPTGEGGE